jgi:hypothetical protein
METKQTAVEWFYENTQNYVRLSDTIPMVIKIEVPFEEYMNILKQAKQMEKEQIIDARANGFIISAEGWNGEFPCMKWSEVIRETKCEEYYNETYGKDNG